jgi:transposase
VRTLTLQLTTEQHSGKSAKDRLVEGERILTDWSAGATVSELCDRYGVSVATLYRRRDRALKARLASTVDQYRERENVTLDETMKRWMRQRDAAGEMVEAGPLASDWGLVERGMKLHADALNGITRTSERRARLNGLDAPAKAEVTVTHTTPVDAAVEALVAEVEAAS